MAEVNGERPRTFAITQDVAELSVERLTSLDRVELLRKAKGMWKDRDDLDDLASLRAEWNRSGQRERM